jgi:hypothetical protein
VPRENFRAIRSPTKIDVSGIAINSAKRFDHYLLQDELRLLRFAPKHSAEPITSNTERDEVVRRIALAPDTRVAPAHRAPDLPSTHPARFDRLPVQEPRP